ncbi:hypothetical protein G3O08_00500 [Cryomorpha ignava]|uniref:RHS repeat-associated core domain-containing protein n=1 Tax=Cryomorpha ignava TaxID=101383 RepID=A0A7K3WK05_9FLAO|nr:hypothetical protein [Cryomorpha ignava]NEN21983.1 hypothetical protein [Cryomorpha ignava]
MYIVGYTAPYLRVINNPDGNYTFSNKTVFPSTSYGLKYYMPMQKIIISPPPGDPEPNVYTRILNDKVYELADHLGNVRAVVSDEKYATLTATVPVDFEPDMVAGNNYYPGGSIMPGRSFNSSATRYGFNGMEKDDEVKGVGNHYSFGDFGYDSRLMRRWNIDPVVKHHESSYAAFANNPIWFTDSDGLDTLMVHRKFLYTKNNIETFLVTFSVIRNNVEYSMDQTMYMGSRDDRVSLPKGITIPLSYDREMSRHEGEWKNQAIHVEYTYTRNDGTQGDNIFIHPTNYPIRNIGCIACSETEPWSVDNSDEDETYIDLYFNDTGTALNKIRDMYVNANGGENGDLLSGKKFLLKTESTARTKGLNKIEPIKGKSIERSQENRNVRTN